jgi:hypothetical protein
MLIRLVQMLSFLVNFSEKLSKLAISHASLLFISSVVRQLKHFMRGKKRRLTSRRAVLEKGQKAERKKSRPPCGKHVLK